MLAIRHGQEISQRILADIALRTNSPRHHAYLPCDVKARHANAAVLSLLACPSPIYPTLESSALAVRYQHLRRVGSNNVGSAA
jgi:hypothetical protein